MKNNRKPRLLLLPVCWIRGHRPEGESIIETSNPDKHFIRQCGRCGCYIFRSHENEMVVTKAVALQCKASYERAMNFQPPETES